MIISVDAMGGDYAPSVVVKGVIEALNRYSDISIKLVGNKDMIKRELQLLRTATHPRIEIVHADEVVLMDDHPSDVIRGKRKSSLHIGLKQVRDKEADAFFSAGNSGAVMAVAMVSLGMLKGISRPALGSVGPSSSHSGKFFMLDIGANVDCKPEHLQAFAVMGVAYANRVLKVDNPTVGLLSNGEEEGKGDNLTKATYQLLKNNKSINFIGNVEAKSLFKGEADVVVCDGFAGNIAIKTSQSISNLLFTTLKSEINKSFIYKIGALLMKDVFVATKKKGDGSHYGGAPLLGVNGVCVIGHGSTNEIGVMNGIRVAREAVYNKMNKAIIEGVDAL